MTATRRQGLRALATRVKPTVTGVGASQSRLTRRGLVLVALVVAFVVLGWRYGARELNAVAAPALVALLVGGVSVWRADCRAIEVNAPQPGTPGDTRTLGIELDGRGLVTVGLDLAEGAPLTEGGSRAETTATLPTAVEWTVELSERGIYELGPLDVRIHGPLGLVERRIERSVDAELVAYPRRYELTEPSAARGQLYPHHDTATQEFDRIREYSPGDPLRRIDWNSSAKHGSLHVIEFADRAGQQAVIIAGVAARATDDQMARTVATLAESALDADLDVGVVVPEGRCEPGSGPTHRERILRLLARTGPSTDAEGYMAMTTDISEQEADVIVDAGDPRIKSGHCDTTVRTAYGTYSLGELRVEGEPAGSETADRGVNG